MNISNTTYWFIAFLVFVKIYAFREKDQRSNPFIIIETILLAVIWPFTVILKFFFT